MLQDVDEERVSLFIGERRGELAELHAEGEAGHGRQAQFFRLTLLPDERQGIADLGEQHGTFVTTQQGSTMELAEKLGQGALALAGTSYEHYSPRRRCLGAVANRRQPLSGGRIGGRVEALGAEL